MSTNGKLVLAFALLAAVYTSACLWATRWIDAQMIGEQPQRPALRAARAIWAVAPRVDRDADAARALKLSWFTAAREVGSGERDLASMMQLVQFEFRFTAEQLGKNLDTMPPALARQYMIQLVTYLNRIEIFQPYPSPALEATLEAFAREIQSEENARVRENWHREMMIRAWVKRDMAAYLANRDSFGQALALSSPGTTAFQGGVIAMYDGVLACIAGDAQRAADPLRLAARQLARQREYARRVLQDHLNALVLARAMAAPGCETPVRSLIAAGV